jgi:hypothetical protein
MNKHLVGAGLLLLSIGFGWTTACSSSNNNSCSIGKESCACTAGGACDPGLVCRSSLCVKLPDGGSTTTQSTTTNGQGGGSTTTMSTTTVPSTTTAGGQGAGGAPTTTQGAGGAPPGGGPGKGGAGGSTPPPDGGSADLGKACAGPADCTGGLQCVRATDSTWLKGGPAHGYCSLPCMLQATCAPFGGICVDMSLTVTPDPWCLQACTWGGTSSSDPVARAAKCHGRTDVACYQGPADDAGVPPAFCSPTCSQDSDCGTRKCDPANSVCVDTPPTGGALGTKCNPMADTCAGGCIPLTKAQYCTQACVLGSINQCNHTAGALTSGGAHGLCALAQTNAQAGDLGFCSQECDTVADCSDKTDTGGVCDKMATMGFTTHGVCSWP